MKINDLITFLEGQDLARRVPVGFAAPHPCHSVWTDVAFEPRYNITLGEMLEAVRSAAGATFSVQKGEGTAEIHVRENTDCWMARPGRSGVYISEPLIEALTGYLPPETSPKRKRPS